MATEFDAAQIQRYRDRTAKLLVWDNRTKVCKVCKKSRSRGQYDEGKEICNQCRKGKHG